MDFDDDDDDDNGVLGSQTNTGTLFSCGAWCSG